MTNKIEIDTRSKTINRGSQTLPKSWQWPSQDSSQGFKTQIEELLSESQAIVCILTECIEDTSVISFLHELAQKGRRIYLLLGKYSEKLDQLRGHCLIRILPSEVLPHGSLILSDPCSRSQKGLLLSSTLKGQSQDTLFCKSNKDEDIKGLFRYFCFLFWERAHTEYLSESDNGRPITDKAVDVYLDVEEIHPHYLYTTFLIDSEGLSRRELLGKHACFASGMQHIYIMASGERDLEDISFDYLPTKKEFEQSVPEDYPDELNYLETTYRWRVLPYYLPQDAEICHYYRDWENYSSITADRLNKLIDEIDGKLDAPRPNIGVEYNRRYSIFDRQLREIRAGLDSLKDFQWGTDPNTETKQKELNDLILRHTTECNQLDKEIKSLDLKQELSINEVEKKRLEQKLNDLRKATSLGSQGKDEQKNRQEDENQKHIKRAEEGIKELEREELRIKVELRDLNNQSDTIIEESSLEYLYSKDRYGKNDKNQLSPPNPSLPILPRVGRLFQVKQKLFLAIDSWDEYDEGIREAKRLNAELCANNN